MSAIASQITSVWMICSIVCSGEDHIKHQHAMSQVFVRVIYRWPVDSPHKGLVTRKMFPFDDVIMLFAVLPLTSVVLPLSLFLFFIWFYHFLNHQIIHYDDIIMGAMASQITSLTIVYSTVYSGTDQRKHQSSASLAFVRGDRWIPRTNGQQRG